MYAWEKGEKSLFPMFLSIAFKINGLSIKDLPWSTVAPLQDLFKGSLEETVGHLVSVAVGLGQVHQVDLVLLVAVALLRCEPCQCLEIETQCQVSANSVKTFVLAALASSYANLFFRNSSKYSFSGRNAKLLFI